MNSASKKVKDWRKHTKDLMIAAMGGKCQCCGYYRCSSALAFHHIDPAEKDTGFGAIRANPKSWPKIVEELKKCVLVCHNCHSEIHAGIRALPGNYTSFNEEFLDLKKKIPHDDCPICGKPKPANNKFCSSMCASKNRCKVDWENIDLLDLMEKHSISELEKMLNVSNAAIYKRRDKILKSLGA